MARNRKNQSASIRFGPVLKVVLLCGLFCGSAVGYVWQKSEIHRLDQIQRRCEIHLDQVRNDNKRLYDQIGVLHSPPMLDQRAKELNLGLAPAQPTQVIRLQEPAVTKENNGARQLTLRSTAGLVP
jgi:hypothetical protein